MACQYIIDGSDDCPNDGVVLRAWPIGARDHILVYVCNLHSQMFDVWARAERERRQSGEVL